MPRGRWGPAWGPPGANCGGPAAAGMVLASSTTQIMGQWWWVHHSHPPVVGPVPVNVVEQLAKEDAETAEYDGRAGEPPTLLRQGGEGVAQWVGS